MPKLDTTEARKRHPDKKDKIDRLEERAKVAELLLDLKDHVGFKLILDSIVKDVISTDLMLREDGKWVKQGNEQVKRYLTERERAELIGGRDKLISLIEVFPDAQRNLEQIESKLARYTA